jgi:hypothetical protein
MKLLEWFALFLFFVVPQAADNVKVDFFRVEGGGISPVVTIQDVENASSVIVTVFYFHRNLLLHMTDVVPAVAGVATGTNMVIPATVADVKTIEIRLVRDVAKHKIDLTKPTR